MEYKAYMKKYGIPFTILLIILIGYKLLFDTSYSSGPFTVSGYEVNTQGMMHDYGCHIGLTVTYTGNNEENINYVRAFVGDREIKEVNVYPSYEAPCESPEKLEKGKSFGISFYDTECGLFSNPLIRIVLNNYSIKSVHERSYAVAEAIGSDCIICQQGACNYTACGSWQSRCYLGKATSTQSPELCEKTGSDLWESKDYCYERMAEMKNDSRLCDKITNNKTRDRCYGTRVVSELDPNICKKISNNDSEEYDSQDWCYIKIIHKTKDLAICDNIVDKYVKNDCLSEEGIDRNLSVCEEMTEDSQRRSLCIQEVAIKTQNISLCNTMPSCGKEECYRAIAIKKQDSSLCDRIMNCISDKDVCYRDIAIAKKDSNLCEKIYIQSIKDFCLKNISSQVAA